MKGPSNLEPCLLTHGYNRQNLSQKDFSAVKNPDRFMTLLADKIKNLKEPENLNDATSSLDKNNMQRLIDVVQSQMNDYLFRELSKFDENSDLSGFNCQWTNVHAGENLEATFGLTSGYDSQKGKEIQSPLEFNDIIEHASKTYQVDPELIRSVIRAESNFDANATSSKGAMGLMQLMPETSNDLGVKNCYNPVENVMAGTRYLKSLLNRYDGNVDLTLAAYNWGMGNLERHPDKLPEETRTYIARVNEYLREGRT